MNKFYMLAGLPGSGKSAYARELKESGAVVHSSDALRAELFGSEDNQDHNNELFTELHRRIKRDLKLGKDVVYDACNLSSKKRAAFLREISKIPCEKICFIIATPYEQCLHQNNQRDRHVPEYRISEMRKAWGTPYWFEGWDSIELKYPSNFYPEYQLTPSEWAASVMAFKQDSPWHNEPLGMHSFMFADYIGKQDPGNRTLFLAGLVHDIGKPATKAFKSAKGEPTDVAHYYGHEHVGAYESLFLNYAQENSVNPLDISIRVNLHMKPHAWEKEPEDIAEKLKKKYETLWGTDLYGEIQLMAQADNYSSQKDTAYFAQKEQENEPEYEK